MFPLTQKVFREYVGETVDGLLIGLYDMIILPQVRHERAEKEGIDDLIASFVSSKRLFNYLIVAVFDEAEFGSFIRLTNRLHHSKLKVGDFASYRRDGLYYVLIDGHRRMRACRHLWEVGCPDCIAKYGPHNDGSCYQRHFGSDQIKVNFYIGITHRRAKAIQLESNLHKSVSPDREAMCLGELWLIDRADNPSLSLKAFAKNHGCSLAKVQEALYFYSLPKLVREAFDSKHIKYGHASQIGRLIDGLREIRRLERDRSEKEKEKRDGFGSSDAELAEFKKEESLKERQEVQSYLRKAISMRPSTREFGRWISARLNELRCAQVVINLGELMELSANETERREKQGELNGSVRAGLNEIFELLRGVEFLCKKSILDPLDSPLLHVENAKLLLATLGRMEQALDTIRRSVEVLRGHAGVPHLQALLAALENLRKTKAEKTISVAMVLTQRVIEASPSPEEELLV